jgi:hypothetical protein
MSIQNFEKIIIIAGALAAVVQATIMCKQLFDTRQQAQALQMLNSEIICRK